MKKLLIIALLGTSLCMGGRTLLVGHRGCNVGVENTVRAFEEGARRGYDFLECDVRVTADTQLVISHDTDTRRLGGNCEIAASTLAQLRADTLHQTRATGDYHGVVATLGEYLDICRRYDVRPVIELKWGTGINSDDFSNIPLLIDTIEAYGMRDKCVILTSMKPCLEHIRRTWPDINLQWLGRTDWTASLPWCDSLRLDVDIAHDMLDSTSVADAHRAGLIVNSWTVDSPERAEELRRMGVDIITTNALPVEK